MKIGQLAASKLNCFKTIPSRKKNHLTESLKDFLLEIRFQFSYLDFQGPPFPNRLSYNAEILRQSGMQTAGRTQTAGCTAATAGYL